MGKFKHLDVPRQWTETFTKYPHGLTIFEALVSWTSQVDKMVDNINDWNDYLDGFVDNFEFELQEEVQSTITKWQNDGLLDGIIESVLETELDNIKSDMAQIATNVKSLGAKGDGVTDDTQVIQNIIDHAEENTTILFPHGTYKISKLNLKSNVRLVGNNATIKTSEVIGFYGDNIENIVIDGFKINGIGSTIMGENSTDGVITILNSNNIKIKNCFIDNSFTGVSVMYSNDVTLSDCEIQNYHTYGVMFSRNDRFIIKNNRIHDTVVTTGTNAYCISATGGGTGLNTTQDYNIIEGNILYNNAPWSAFMSHYTEKLLITNNIIFNCRNAIDLSSSNTIKDVIISNNYMEGTDIDTWNGESASNLGLMIIATTPGNNPDYSNINITGNIIKNFGKFTSPQAKSQVYITRCNNITFNSNIIEHISDGSTYSGAVSISRETNNVNITNNNFNVITGGIGLDIYLFYGEGLVVTGNTFKSQGTPIRLSGSDCSKLIIENNISNNEVVYRETGTNIVDGISLSAPYGGRGEAKKLRMRLPADDVIGLVSKGVATLKTINIPEGGLAIGSIVNVGYSKMSNSIQCYGRVSDSGNIIISVVNHGETTVDLTGGVISVEIIELT